MLLQAIILILVATSLNASPLERERRSASTFAGETIVQSILPTQTSINPLFPNSAQVGYPGPYTVGAEPFAAEETGIVHFPKNTGKFTSYRRFFSRARKFIFFRLLTYLHLYNRYLSFSCTKTLLYF